MTASLRIALAATCIAVFATAAVAEDAEPKFKVPYIWVDGTAAVEVKPDRAELSLGVIVERPTADAALAENASQSAAAIADLKQQGIDPSDIKTASLDVTPLILEDRDPKTNAVTGRHLAGYRASHRLLVRLRDVDRAGAIVSHVVANGANTFGGVWFQVSDREDRIDALRAKAVGVAMKRAALYAHGASMKLGRLLALNPDPQTDNAGAADLPLRKSVPAERIVVPIEPGTEFLEAHVTAAWELVPE
jgi:uncharacterized protein YggE